MAESSAGLHEAREVLSSAVQDRHRALASLMEELEAVDWYAQRVEASSDEDLKAILQHNLEEEQEHAAMVLEWLRRRDAHLDEMLRTYIFSQGEITQAEEKKGAEEASSSEAGSPSDGSLGIGCLREGGAP